MKYAQEQAEPRRQRVENERLRRQLNLPRGHFPDPPPVVPRAPFGQGEAPGLDLQLPPELSAKLRSELLTSLPGDSLRSGLSTALLGGVLGSGFGLARGNIVGGIGRGLVRGGLTGAGLEAGGRLGGALGSLTNHAGWTAGSALLGTLLGGGAGWQLGGRLLGEAGKGTARADAPAKKTKTKEATVQPMYLKGSAFLLRSLLRKHGQDLPPITPPAMPSGGKPSVLGQGRPIPSMAPTTPPSVFGGAAGLASHAFGGDHIIGGNGGPPPLGGKPNTLGQGRSLPAPAAAPLSPLGAAFGGAAGVAGHAFGGDGLFGGNGPPLPPPADPGLQGSALGPLGSRDSNIGELESRIPSPSEQQMLDSMIRDRQRRQEIQQQDPGFAPEVSRSGPLTGITADLLPRPAGPPLPPVDLPPPPVGASGIAPGGASGITPGLDWQRMPDGSWIRSPGGPAAPATAPAGGGRPTRLQRPDVAAWWHHPPTPGPGVRHTFTGG